MPSLDDLGHDEFELLARLAFGYYEEGLTQEALARRFGLSRPKVQRLLDRARAAASWTSGSPPRPGCTSTLSASSGGLRAGPR